MLRWRGVVRIVSDGLGVWMEKWAWHSEGVHGEEVIM